MIYILDDTLSQRAGKIDFLYKEPYSSICKTIDKPMLKHNIEILQSFSVSGSHLLCIHRSLRFYNENNEIITSSDNYRNSLIKQVKEKQIKCIVFGRDMNNNKPLFFIDKDMFYRNLQLYMDHFIEGDMEENILYDGPMYKIADRKKLLDEIITILNLESSPFDHDDFITALGRYFPNSSPKEVIGQWVQKNMNKKEIRRFLNDNLFSYE